MIVTRIRALRGPNLWSRHTAIEAVVNCRPEENSIAELPGFEARLRARFPALGAWPTNSPQNSLAQGTRSGDKRGHARQALEVAEASMTVVDAITATPES